MEDHLRQSQEDHETMVRIRVSSLLVHTCFINISAFNIQHHTGKTHGGKICTG